MPEATKRIAPCKLQCISKAQDTRLGKGNRELVSTEKGEICATCGWNQSARLPRKPEEEEDRD